MLRFLKSIDGVRLDSEIYILKHNNTHCLDFTEVYRTTPDEELVANELNIDTSKSIWDRRSDLMGIQLRVGVVNDTHFASLETRENKTYLTGVAVSIAARTDELFCQPCGCE